MGERISSQRIPQERSGLSYSRIPDESLRIPLRVGELIFVAATTQGIHLSTPDDCSKGDDWVRCTQDRVMEALRSRFDQHTITTILKRAGKIAKRSQLNGDEGKVVEEIRGLITQVGRPRITPPVLPQIP